MMLLAVMMVGGVLIRTARIDSCNSGYYSCLMRLSSCLSASTLMRVVLMLHLFGMCSTVAQSADNFDAFADVSAGHNNTNSFDMHYDNFNQLTSNNDTRILRRGKRYLEFSKGSRMSWRTNGKNNLIKINTLFAYAYGFRANYPFPDPEDQRKRNRVLFKRDLFSKLETALNGHGFDGRACLLKSFCTALIDVDKPQQKSGMLFKLLKLIFRPDIFPTAFNMSFEIQFSFHASIVKMGLLQATLLLSVVMSAVSLDQNVTLSHHRSKRYLDIIETTRIFFRVNVKNNMIPKPTVWAHGYGFRANTPVLVKRENRPFRRDTFELIQEIVQRSGFDGQACVLKAYCAASSGEHSQGFLFKLMKYMFTLEDHEKHHMPYLREENCQQILHSHCPLSFDSISPYTDDV